jgi:hypothetical protein
MGRGPSIEMFPSMDGFLRLRPQPSLGRSMHTQSTFVASYRAERQTIDVSVWSTSERGLPSIDRPKGVGKASERATDYLNGTTGVYFDHPRRMRRGPR